MLFRSEPGFYAATALALVQIVHFRVTEGGFMDFAVQVRIAVFLIFLAALWFRPLFWLPAFGLFARITVNYCLTARTLALMPWNRKEPLSAKLIRHAYFSPPTGGSVKP